MRLTFIDYGVGAFGDAITAILAKRFFGPLSDFALVKHRTILGIGPGMQFFEGTSEGHGHHKGLSWLAVDVAHLVCVPLAKAPYAGRNAIRFAPSG